MHVLLRIFVEVFFESSIAYIYFCVHLATVKVADMGLRKTQEDWKTASAGDDRFRPLFMELQTVNY